MKIIITGGTGAIGRALTAELLQAGHQVTIFSRNPQKSVTGTKTVVWDIENIESWLPEIEKVDAIVHLAGENLAGEGFLPKRWTLERKKRIVHSRSQTGKALTQAIQRAQPKPKIFIQASAIGYYGPRKDEIITENFKPGGDFLAQTCLEWENSTKPLENLGVRRAIIRTGIVLTPQEGALSRLLLPYKMYVGGPFGNGKQWYSWIHIADEVAAIRFLIEKPAAVGTFNLTTPTPLTNRDFGKTLGKVLKRPSWLPIPAFALNLFLGEVSSVVLDSQRVLPGRLQELGYKFKFPELRSALEDLLLP
ncbi:MAG TPA: TIGR01777 family protein [Chloroflexi bacterium]|nr:TIGR01777 family protein [Chloroflexota bacterium]